MTLQIRNQDRSFRIRLPAGLLFSGMVFRMAARFAGIEGLTPQAAEKLARELRRIRKQHGTWELVEVQSADGDCVRVTL